MKSLAFQRWIAGATASLLLMTLAGCPLCPGTPVYLPDPALEFAVRQALNAPLSCLTRERLRDLTELQAANLGITRLDGLEHCPNLTVLNASGNAIKSITPLTSLVNMTHLDLSTNEISNIQAISGMFFLDVLNLGANPVQDWRPLQAVVDNGGFQEGSVVTVGAEAVTDSSDNILPTFQPVLDALLAAGVNVNIQG
jgi:Leucine-rich repeat (LRR) protein